MKVWEGNPRRNASSVKQSKAKVRKFDLPSRATLRTILLVRINFSRE